LRKIQPGKALMAALLYAVFLVIAPYYLFGYLMAPPNSFPIPASIVQTIFVFGVISSAVAFIEHLFVRGTRERGILSLIFTVWFTFNLYYLIGGGLNSSGTFGEIAVSIGYYSVVVNVAFIAMLIIGLGVLTAIIHLYEAIA
jgi:hypothetical protein